MSFLKWALFFSFFATFINGCINKTRFSEKDILELKPAKTIMLTDSCSAKILFLGDLAFGENYQIKYTENILETEGYLYSFRNILPLLQKSNYIIANLETPVTSLDSANAVDINKTYLHFADTVKTPESLQTLGIDAVSLANNHSMDFGELGLKQTQNLLSVRNIKSFGAGKNEKEATLPIKLKLASPFNDLNIYVLATYQYSKSNDKYYSFYAKENKPGTTPLFSNQLGNEIRLIKDTDPKAFVIIFPHWGSNYVWKNRKQTRFAHNLINAGADLIIGHGAHRIQEIELISNKPVLYSIGNSVFNSAGRFDQKNSIKYSFIVSLEFYRNRKDLKCYPIFSDNRITRFQPHFLGKNEVIHLAETLKEKSNFPTVLAFEKDTIGYFFKIPIKN